MAFIDSTSTQRVELLRQAEKTANLTRRVTIGSGNMDGAAEVDGDALCTDLSVALADIGYGGLPPGGAMVNSGDAASVLKLGGDPLVSGYVLVEDEGFKGIEIPDTYTVVNNSKVLSLVNSVGGDAHNVTVTVSQNAVSNVKLSAATMTVVDNSDSVVIQKGDGTAAVTGTAIVANGVISGVRMPAANAVVSTGGLAPLQITTGAAVTGYNASHQVSNGTYTAIRLPAGIAPVMSGPITGVTVTGTYTSSVELTVTLGVLTAITLS